MKGKIAVVLLLALVFASVVHAEAVKVVVNDITPQPVAPGNDLTARVTFTSVESTSKRITASLDLRYPFALKTSSEPFDKGFDLCAFCSRTNSYFISVDSGTKSGTYPIFIRTSDTGEVRTIDVRVSGKPNVVLFAAPVTNATPSAKFDLVVDATNIGTGAAKEVKVISKSTDFVALGSSIVTVDGINTSASARVTFSMVGKDSLDAGAYNLPFDIIYTDETGAAYNATQNIGVQLVNSGLLSIQNIKAAASAGGQMVAGMPAIIVVRLQNVGTGDVDYIESEITCDGQNVESFLGQLKRDEDAPAVFELAMPRGGKYKCSFETRYTDDLGEHSISSSFDINVKDPDFPILVPVIIIAAAGFYLYRKRKAKK